MLCCNLALNPANQVKAGYAWTQRAFRPAHALLSYPFGIPLPPPRPSDLTPLPQTAAPPASQSAVPEASEPDPACARILSSAKLVAASIAPIKGPGDCGIANPVRLEAVILADGTHIPFEPSSTIDCELAEALGDWMRDDVAPLADKAGSRLAKILGSDGYECRSRNHIEGAKLSEHGKGNAFDLRGFALHDGRQLLIEHQTDARDFMAELKPTSCARFKTVLGPGSDSYHETHLHVDLAKRHGDYRMCQWDLK